jgi:hypothetical protein
MLSTDLERECKEFKWAIHGDTALREELEIKPIIVSVADGCRSIGMLFSMLMLICCRIATVLPGMSILKSYFSVINWEYDDQGEPRGLLS